MPVPFSHHPTDASIHRSLLQFYAKFTEPTCVKSLKMTILPRIANATSAREIVSELTEYVAG